MCNNDLIVLNMMTSEGERDQQEGEEQLFHEHVVGCAEDTLRNITAS